MHHKYLSTLLLLILSYELCEGQKDFEEVCIRCLCNSFTECKSLKNCARKTINNNYWLESMRDEIDYNDEMYDACKEDDECIIKTIRNFVNLFGHVDCNGDNQMDCTDYAAIHLSRSRDCKNYEFPRGYRFRLNGCIMREFGRNGRFTRPVLPGIEPAAV